MVDQIIYWGEKFKGRRLSQVPEWLLKQIATNEYLRLNDTPMYVAARELCKTRGLSLEAAPAGADAKQIKIAALNEALVELTTIYTRVASEYHPDKHASKPEEEKKQFDKAMSALNGLWSRIEDHIEKMKGG